MVNFVYSLAQDPTLTPGANFDLSAWKLQTLRESDNSFTEISNTSELKVHSSKFFYTDGTDGAMVFRVPSNGGTTSSGTKYPRVELRQTGASGNWKLSDENEHYLTAQCQVIEVAQVKPKTIIGQIHGSESNSEMLKLRWTGYKDGECFVEARFQTNDNAGSEYGVKLATGLSLGDMIDYSISMKNGEVIVTVNGNSASQTYTSQFYGTTDRYYFKAGNYIQWNDEIVSAPPVVFGVNKLYKLSLHRDTGTSIIDLNEVNKSFKIYPNPAIDYVILETNSSKLSNAKLQIFDESGRLRMEMNYPKSQLPGGNSQRISLSELESGLYYIRIISDSMAETKKLLISNQQENR